MRIFLLSAAILSVSTALPALAADMAAVEPAPAQVVYEQPNTGGWYIRGDLGGHWANFGEAEYITYGAGVPLPGTDILEGDLDGAFTLGAGVGYQINSHFRTDVTADYWFKSDFNGSSSNGATTDTSSMSAWLLLANAYVDLGTWGGFTPYIGGGIGGAHVKWDDLTNTPPGVEHPGSSNWRFAAAVMAGASYCLTDKLQLDAGYRFTHVEGGRMFEQVGTQPGPGFDDGLNVHEVRGGLRYALGGSAPNCAPEPVAYEPAVEPVYK
ncbi:MAG: porin family protein [Mesorhizobium sp.]